MAAGRRLSVYFRKCDRPTAVELCPEKPNDGCYSCRYYSPCWRSHRSFSINRWESPEAMCLLLSSNRSVPLVRLVCFYCVINVLIFLFFFLCSYVTAIKNSKQLDKLFDVGKKNIPTYLACQ